MMFGSYIGGIYPRSERLIDATRKNSPNLKSLFVEEKKKIISLQVKAGLSYISDPLIDWDDMLRPFLRLEGFEQGSLNRIFEKNTFYRTPVAAGKIRGGGKLALTSLSTRLLPKSKPWKADLPDPYTVVALSKNLYYKNRKDFVIDVAKALAREARTLENKGVKLIQVNGPSLCYVRGKEDLGLAKEALKILTKGLNVKFYLHLYFGNPKPVLSDILDFHIHGIGLDSLAVDGLKGFKMGDKGLALGCVDAGNTRIDRPDQIVSEAKKICSVLEPRELYLCPNYDLEYIPHLYARRKIIKLGEALNILRDE